MKETSLLQELADLGTVTSAEQLRANATATAARSMRYPVRLSAFAFELLMAFLKGARLFLPLGSLKRARQPAGAGPEQALVSLLAVQHHSENCIKLSLHTLAPASLSPQPKCCWFECYSKPA